MADCQELGPARLDTWRIQVGALWHHLAHVSEHAAFTLCVSLRPQAHICAIPRGLEHINLPTLESKQFTSEAHAFGRGVSTTFGAG
jgi:hypothetical protein